MGPIEIALYLTSGAAIGALHLYLLHRFVRMHTGGVPAKHLLALSILRIALTAAVFWVIVQAGAMPALVALLGFLIARAIAVRKAEAA